MDIWKYCPECRKEVLTEFRDCEDDGEKLLRSVDQKMKPITNREFERIKKEVIEEMKKNGFTVKKNEYLNPERWI